MSVVPRIVDIPQESTSFLQQCMAQVASDLQKQLESIFIEGLTRKGFKFQSQSDLEAFIRANCVSVDNVELKERTYYVYGSPFMVHFYEPEIEPQRIGRELLLAANYGRYAYL